jgi:hypothetical protein
MTLRPKLARSEVRGPNAQGTPCQRPARLPVGRCKLHGGASTGGRTKDGLGRLTEAKIKLGKFTKEKRAEARCLADQGRQMRGELKESWRLGSWKRSFGQEMVGSVQVSPAPSVVRVTLAKRDSSHLKHRRRYHF